MKKELLIAKRKIHVLHIANVEHVRDGKVLWSEENLDNILHDEGEQAILSAYFATTMTGYGAPPANLYLGLDARASLAEDDVLTDLTNEPSTGGYARKALSTAGTGASGQDFYINQPAAYYRADSKTVSWTASEGTIGPVTRLFLCTASTGTSGKLIATVDLTATRTLADGDTLNASIYVGLSEPA